jgi:hypothetical protein
VHRNRDPHECLYKLRQFTTLFCSPQGGRCLTTTWEEPHGDKMKNLSIAFLAAVSLMSFAGCKKKPGGGDSLAKMTEFKDQMCKCADKACADKVNADYMKWGEEMKKEMGEAKEPPKMSEEETKKQTEVAMAYSTCMAKQMTPPPPAAPAGDKPADPAAAPPAGDKPADPAAPPAAPAGDKPAGGSAN